MIRAALAALAVVGLLGASAATAAGLTATMVAATYKAGSTQFDAVVAIPKAIDTAARTGGADWGLDVTVTYISGDGTVETLDTGRLSIKNDTTLIGSIDDRTDAIVFPVPLGSHPAPGNNPSATGTAQLLNPGS